MSGYWVLKTEPSTYSYEQMEKEGTTVWDGVRNPFALRNMEQMKVGDPVLIYHTGSEKACVGRAVVTGEARPDPKEKNPSLVVVELKAEGRLPRSVPLAAIKADPEFASNALVRQGRLSVVPLTKFQFERLLAMAQA